LATHASRSTRRTRSPPLGSLMHRGALPDARQVWNVEREIPRSAQTSSTVNFSRAGGGVGLDLFIAAQTEA
jgi:hypothetical protein